MTPLQETVSNLHEMFTEMLDRGFTEAQACRIIGVAIATGNGGGE
jgi:hypothetical protein